MKRLTERHDVASPARVYMLRGGTQLATELYCRVEIQVRPPEMLYGFYRETDEFQWDGISWSLHGVTSTTFWTSVAEGSS